MTSWQMRAVALYVRATRKRRYLTSQGGRRLLEAEKGSPAPPDRLLRELAVSRQRVGGFEVVTVTPEYGVSSDASVVYLHGGAYVSEIVTQHWALVAELAREVRVDVHVPLYGLAPRHSAVEAITFVEEVLASLPRGGVHLVGDSAGGGLALAAAQRWPASAPATLRGLTLIAPWLDLSMTNPGIDAVEPLDPWLARPGLRVVADAWAGGLPLDDPRVSPINGPLEGLPVVDLHVGTRDITLPDCRLLRDRLGPTGVRYHEQPGALHVHPLLPVPEGRRARRQIVEQVRTTLDAGP